MCEGKTVPSDFRPRSHFVPAADLALFLPQERQFLVPHEISAPPNLHDKVPLRIKVHAESAASFKMAHKIGKPMFEPAKKVYGPLSDEPGVFRFASKGVKMEQRVERVFAPVPSSVSKL